MLSFQDVEVRYPSESNSFEWNGVSLNKLTGKKVVDVFCRMGDEYSDSAVVAIALMFNDGSTLTLQGEHDIVYIHDYNNVLPSEEDLENIFHTDPDNE